MKAMTNKPCFYLRTNGDGFEMLDANGQVIAWTLDSTWGLRILVALEIEHDELAGRDENER
jgi:hypothetical protein